MIATNFRDSLDETTIRVAFARRTKVPKGLLDGTRSWVVPCGNPTRKRDITFSKRESNMKGRNFEIVGKMGQLEVVVYRR